MKKKLELSELRVESFATAAGAAPTFVDESFTGRYGGDCVSLPPNCLQSARKCI